MPGIKKVKAVIAICIQEPKEDGSSMELGAIQGDDLRFLHQAFITDSVNQALGVADADVRLCFIDNDERRHFVEIVTSYLEEKRTGSEKTSFKKRFSLSEMGQDRWGIRIEQIFEDCFAAGYTHVLVAGSRTPSITSKMMHSALSMLRESDAVFGPTVEGRYYLIGMSGAYQINLSEFSWKSPRIYSEVAEAFTSKELSWAELGIWYTVEAPEDIDTLARDINQYRFEGDLDTARETELVLERILSKMEQ